MSPGASAPREAATAAAAALAVVGIAHQPSLPSPSPVSGEGPPPPRAATSPLRDSQHLADDVIVAPHQPLVGQPVAAIVDRLIAADVDDGAAACARAEFSIAWPPTFPVGGAAEVVELRAAVSLDAAVAAIGGGADDGGGGGAWAVGGGAEAALASAAAGCCSRLLAVREDVVVGDEAVKMTAPGGGRARARLRLHSDHPGVTTCILTGQQGIPTLESFEEAAPLLGLPQAARDEAHRLLWRMMHEALPPNHSVLPYDPDAFRSPVDLLPPRLQAALSWAWSHHFRAFAQDLGFLLDASPPRDAAAAAAATAATAATAAAAGVSQAPAHATVGDVTAGVPRDADDCTHYPLVLAQMVGFLRDNDMFACLATLLQTAVARGLALAGGGEGQGEGDGGAAVGGGGGCTAAAGGGRLTDLEVPPASPSAASEAVAYEPSSVADDDGAATVAPPTAAIAAQVSQERLPRPDLMRSGGGGSGGGGPPAFPAPTAAERLQAAHTAAVSAGEVACGVAGPAGPRRWWVAVAAAVVLLRLVAGPALTATAELRAAGAVEWRGAGGWLLAACMTWLLYGISPEAAGIERRWRRRRRRRCSNDGSDMSADADVDGLEHDINSPRIHYCRLRRSVVLPYLPYLTGAVSMAAATWHGVDVAAAAAAAAATSATVKAVLAATTTTALLLAAAMLPDMPHL